MVIDFKYTLNKATLFRCNYNLKMFGYWSLSYFFFFFLRNIKYFVYVTRDIYDLKLINVLPKLPRKAFLLSLCQRVTLCSSFEDFMKENN